MILSDSELRRMRLSTHTKRPLGSDSFLSKLEKLLSHRVHQLPVGRLKKEKKEKKKPELNRVTVSSLPHQSRNKALLIEMEWRKLGTPKSKA